MADSSLPTYPGCGVDEAPRLSMSDMSGIEKLQEFATIEKLQEFATDGEPKY